MLERGDLTKSFQQGVEGIAFPPLNVDAQTAHHSNSLSGSFNNSSVGRVYNAVTGWVKSWFTDDEPPKDTPRQPPRHQEPKPPPIPRSVNIILDAIGGIEAHNDYNIANGDRRINFTNMTIDEVIEWQTNDESTNGDLSAAAGKYQIMRPTLEGLKTNLGLTGDERFDKGMQDRLGVELLKEIGLNDFLNGKKSVSSFMGAISGVWASVPKDASGKGSYDGLAGNRALVSPREFASTLESARFTYVAEARRSSPGLKPS